MLLLFDQLALRFLAIVIHGNPVLFMVNAFRYGSLGMSDISLTLDLSIIVGLIMVLWIYAHSLMSRVVEIKS